MGKLIYDLRMSLPLYTQYVRTSSQDNPHEVFGFKYWSNPGAFSNGALGVVNAFVLASFSMQGTEIVGITAGECENPLKVNHIILHHKASTKD